MNEMCADFSLVLLNCLVWFLVFLFLFFRCEAVVRYIFDGYLYYLLLFVVGVVMGELTIVELVATIGGHL